MTLKQLSRFFLAALATVLTVEMLLAAATIPSVTTLVCSPNPSTFGQAVSLTASVSPASATGKVTFYDGATVLGIGTLSGGQASLVTTLLTSGNRSLRAYYGGDTAVGASTSVIVAQSVVALPQSGFQTAVNYNTGSSPRVVTVGDFNGDGRPDLAVANNTSNNVSVLLGNGDGTFRSAVNYSTGNGSVCVAVGDFNRDGKADLVVANAGSNNLSVLVGNGDGTFQAAINYGVGMQPIFVVLGDFNGDGKVDLAVANVASSSNNVSILLGNGDGTFQAATNYGVGKGPVSLAIADLNGDGKTDLAVANDVSNDVSVLLGNGDGTFQSAVNYNVGTGPVSVAVGDLNGDGRADLAVSNIGGGGVSILLGRGDGTFQSSTNHAFAANVRWVAIADFNADGKPDLVIASGFSANINPALDGSNNVIVVPGNGDGTFQPSISYPVGGDPEFLTVGDFNGDGTADLAVVNVGGNNLSVLLGLGFPALTVSKTHAGSFAQGQTGATYSITASNAKQVPTAGAVTIIDTLPLALTATDISGTGWTCSLSALTCTRGDALGTSASYPPITVKVNIRPTAPASVTNIATVSGGGGNAISTASDLTTILQSTVVTLAQLPNPILFGQALALTATVSPVAATGRVTFYDGVTVVGTSTLSNGQASLTTNSLPRGSHALRAYYGGGALYLPAVSAVALTSVVALPQNGFRAAVTYATGTGPFSLAVGDINGDGRPDIAVANQGNNNISVLIGNGDGTFRPAVNYNVGNAPAFVSIGDFNGDGRVDLAVVNYNSSNLSVLLGNGNGTFQTAVNYPVGNNPLSVAIGDFDADGKIDLAVANQSGNNVSVLLGNGDGTFQPAVNYGAGSSPRSVVLGDFNGDGKADLVLANYGSNNVSVLLGKGDGTFQGAANFNVGTSPDSLTVGDFNGDGRSDIVAANYGSNNVSVLLGNGDGTFQVSASYNTGTFPASVTLGDFNGDGKADLAVANTGSNNVSILLGIGDGTFQSAISYNAGTGPSSLALGDFNGDGASDLAVANQNGNNVSVLLGISTVAAIDTGGVVTGANYVAQLTPGVIASVFGSNLSSSIMTPSSLPLPTALGGVSVSVNGSATPLFYVSPKQINFQLPWELLGQSQASVVVTTNGFTSAPQTITLRTVAPGIFSTNSSGSGQGAIQISNTAIFAAPEGSMPGNLARPAMRGESVTIYCSGLGDVSPRPATGAPSPVSPLSGTLLTPSVTIGGVPALVSFAGLTPGFVGLYQVNAQVPNAAPSGGQVQVMMTVGGVNSNTVTVAVQ